MAAFSLGLFFKYSCGTQGALYFKPNQGVEEQTEGNAVLQCGCGGSTSDLHSTTDWGKQSTRHKQLQGASLSFLNYNTNLPISLVSQLTQYNKLYSVLKCKVQTITIKVGKKHSYNQPEIAQIWAEKYPLEIQKITMKKEHVSLGESSDITFIHVILEKWY